MYNSLFFTPYFCLYLNFTFAEFGLHGAYHVTYDLTNQTLFRFQQVLAKPGTTLRETLSKAMKMRELTPDMCVVYKRNTNVKVGWDTDMMYLAGEEVSFRV